MALIPTFNDGDTLGSIRLQSLNPVISKVNEINGRLGKSLKTVSHIDEQHTTGWYYVKDGGSGGKGEGLLQYFAILDNNDNFQYIRQLHHPSGISGKYDAREWKVADGYWTTWVDSHSGGFKLEPNPPVADVNVFSSTTEVLAYDKRDAYMTKHPDIFAKYQLDTLLLIILIWPDPTEPTKKVVVYQNYFNNEWLDAFGHFTSAIDFTSHTIGELKDGNRVTTLERTVVTSVECPGSETDIDLCEGLIKDNTLKLSKLRNNSSKYLKISKITEDHPVEFGIRPTWFGTFETLAEAISKIPTEDLIDKETSFMVSGANSNRGRIYYWGGEEKEFLPLHPEGSIFATVDGNKVSVDQIKAGDHVTLVQESDGVIKISADISSVPPSINVNSLGRNQTVETLKIPSSFGSFNDATKEFNFPINRIYSSNGVEKGEFISLSEGSGIVIEEIGSNSGQYSVKTTINPVLVSKDAGVTQTHLKNLNISNEFSTIDNSTGTLSIPPITSLDATGASLGQVKTLKEGDGVILSMGIDSDKGVLTISTTGGGGGGTIKAKTPNSIGGTYSDINKINVVGDSDLSNVASGELSINVKSCILESISLDELNTNFPPTEHEGRFGIVTNGGLFYWSDGTVWRFWGYHCMGNHIQSLHLRFPEQFTTGAGYTDESSKNLGYQHIPREIAGKAIESGGLAIPEPEDGILQSLYKEDLRWVQLFYGLETGNLWSRFYDASNHWHHWKLFGGIEEGHYAVMTTYNDQSLNGYQDGTKPIPYQVVQDPSENIKMVDGMPTVMNKGVYDLTYCIHLSNDIIWPSTITNFRIEIRRADSQILAPAITGSIVAPTDGKDRGMYPAIIARFERIPMLVGQKTELYVTVTGDASGIETSTLDPYKNFLVIEPTSSDTKTGMNIAKTLHNTLGGISFTNGYEMRSTPSTDDPLNPRVFGSLYNKEFSELPPSTPEIEL